MEKYFYLSSYLNKIDIEEILEFQNRENLIEEIFNRVTENIRVAQNLHILCNENYADQNKEFIIEDIEKILLHFVDSFRDSLIPFVESEFFSKPLETKPKIEYLIMKLDNLISNLKGIHELIKNKEVKDSLIEFIHTSIILTHDLYSFTPGFIYNFKWNPEEWIDLEWKTNRLIDIPMHKQKVPKQTWNLPTRYKLFKELGFMKTLLTFKSRTEQNYVLSQIMGINVDNAKKLINETYNGKIDDAEELECSQQIEKYNNSQHYN